MNLNPPCFFRKPNTNSTKEASEEHVQADASRSALRATTAVSLLKHCRLRLQ